MHLRGKDMSFFLPLISARVVLVLFFELSTNAIDPDAADALWSGTNKNRDVSTGPLARPFARSLAPLTRSLALDCSLCLRPPLRSLIRSLPRSWESEWLDVSNWPGFVSKCDVPWPREELIDTEQPSMDSLRARVFLPLVRLGVTRSTSWFPERRNQQWENETMNICTHTHHMHTHMTAITKWVDTHAFNYRVSVWDSQAMNLDGSLPFWR